MDTSDEETCSINENFRGQTFWIITSFETIQEWFWKTVIRNVTLSLYHRELVTLLHITTLVQGSVVNYDFSLVRIGSDKAWWRVRFKKFILNHWYQRIDFRFRFLDPGFKRRILIYFGNESMNIEVFYCEGVLELWDYFYRFNSLKLHSLCWSVSDSDLFKIIPVLSNKKSRGFKTETLVEILKWPIGNQWNLRGWKH